MGVPQPPDKYQSAMPGPPPDLPAGPAPAPAAPAPPAYDPQPLDPNYKSGPGSHPFTEDLSSRLSKPIEPGKSIFDPQVLSSYFDDPSVSENDKGTILAAIEPNKMTQAFDAAVAKAVGGEPVRSTSLLGRAMGQATDIAGKPIGKVFDALMWPANKTEQVFGTALMAPQILNGDLSLSEAWSMGRLTYEAYGNDGNWRSVTSGGRWWQTAGSKQLETWYAEVASGNKTIDQVYEEHHGGVPDMVGTMIYDPLWLLGGFPAVPGKLFKAGEKGAEVYKTGIAARFFRGLSQGIRVEHYGPQAIKVAGALEKLGPPGKVLSKAGRLMFGDFLPSQDKIIANAMREMMTAIDESAVPGVIENWRSLKGLFELTPGARADGIATHLYMSTALAKASKEDLAGLAHAIETGDVSLVPKVFGTAAWSSARGRIAMQAMKDMGIDLRKFPSMEKAIAPDQAIWDAADIAAKKGDKAAAEFVRTTHRNEASFTNAMQVDLHNIAYPAIQQWHGVTGELVKTVLKSGEVVHRFEVYHSPMVKIANAMKFGLSMALLNKPGFPALNLANNGSTLAFDWGLSRGVKYWLDPFGRRGHLEKGLKEVLESAGITPEIVKSFVGDRSMQLESLGITHADDKLLGIKKTWMTPAMTLTAKWDMGARMHAFYEMYGRATNALGRFESQGGALPDIPAELASKLGPAVTERLRGSVLASFSNPESLRAIAETIAKTGRPPLTAEHYLERMAGSMGLEGDARQAFHDMFEPAFKTRITAILADAGNSTSKLTARLDVLRGAMRQQEHQAREMDGLMPRARDYQGLPTAMADHEALMAERDKEQLIQMRRYLVSTGEGNVNEALTGLAQVQANARTRRYTMQYASQLLDIAPQSLEGSVMFQLVPDAMRADVKALHRELVLGLGEITPERSGFYEVLGDMAAKWETHSEQTMTELTDHISTLYPAGTDVPQPLMDFFDSMARAEGDVAKSRDQVFADMINNHPGADAEAGVQDWIQTRWTEHYRQLDNVYNDALQREADIFGFEHRFAPHAQGGEYPTVGEMLGVRNSHLNQYMDYVQAQHLGDATAQPFIAGAGAEAQAAWATKADALLKKLSDPSKAGNMEELTRLMDEFRAIDPGRAAKMWGPAEHVSTGARVSDKQGALQGASAGSSPGWPYEATPDEVMGDLHKLAGELRGARGGADELTKYIDELTAIAPDAKATISLIARRAADFTMLNYDRRYGHDQWMTIIYPYTFWPTRSMWHWAQRGAARPGAVAATGKLYELNNEINQQAGVPSRFSHGIRIPIPFLDKSLQGGSMYFDPIQVMFPTAQWSQDNNFGDATGNEGTTFGIPKNWYGLASQWAKVVGPGLNPFIDGPLQYAAGEDTALYLKYKMASLPFMIPGPRQLQALYSFAKIGEDPENLLPEQVKEKYATGQALNENELKQILGMSPDQFDLYRAQRVLANQVGDYMLQGHSIEERQTFIDAALGAMFTRKGPLWANAQKTAQHEAGLAVATGWLFGMPVRQYPNGEATQRGLDALYKQAQEASRAAGGGDMTKGFLAMFPEMEAKNAAVAIFDGTDKQASEIAGSLFASNLDRVHAKFDDRIAHMNAVLDQLAKSDTLKTREGRRAFDVTEAERNALTQQRSLEIDNLDKTYDARNQDPSMSRTPRTRALQELETAYYNIELPEKATSLDFQKQQAAQDAFIARLPKKQEYSPLIAAVDHYAKMREFDKGITDAYDAGDQEKARKLIEERQKFVLDSTTITKTGITQKEFTSYLARNKRVPTTQELEANQASDEMSQYFALKDRAGSLGYTSKETSALAATFWKAHPLLETYYGGASEVKVHTYEDVARYDRMEKIWEQFYSLAGGSQARIDYLAMTLDELNGLRKHFGLKAVSITDPYWDHSAPPPRYQGSAPQGY